jgi:hypothetical protein
MDSLKLAEMVQTDVLAKLNAHGWAIPDRGVVADTSLGGPALDQTDAGHPLLLGPPVAGYLSTPSEMPGALAEPLFITDPSEATIAASAVGQHAIAAGIVDAVKKDLARPPTLSSPANGSPPFAKSVVGGVPLVMAWSVPPAAPGQGQITVAMFDPARTRLVLHAGSVQPVQGESWISGPQIGPLERSVLLAAFNGGFKISDSRGGWYSEGRTISPMVAGAASVVIYADGGFDIGAWGRDVPVPDRPIASVRQNLQLLIDGGQPQLQGANREAQLEQWWGIAFQGKALISRSALGVTASGALLWAAGTDITVNALTEALLAHGVVRALELDVNAPLVRGFLYEVPATIQTLAPLTYNTLPLVAGQTQTAADFGPAGTGASSVPHCTYLTTCSRDFFTVLTR